MEEKKNYDYPHKEIIIKVIINGKNITNIIATTGYGPNDIQELEVIGVLQNLIQIQQEKLDKNKVVQTKRWPASNKS